MRSLSATQHAPYSTSPLLGYQNGAFPCHMEVAYRKTDFMCALLQRRELNAGRVLLRAELGELGHLLNLIYSERDLRERHEMGGADPAMGRARWRTRRARRAQCATALALAVLAVLVAVGTLVVAGEATGATEAGEGAREDGQRCRERAGAATISDMVALRVSLSALLASTTTRAPAPRASDQRRLR